MIAILPFTLVAVMQALPCEYVIDFGAEAVPFEYRMVITCEARDGTDLELPITFTANTDPKGNRDFLEHALKTNGWGVRAGDGSSLVVVGRSKGDKSPIKLVTLKSEKLIPIQVRWVPLMSEKKK